MTLLALTFTGTAEAADTFVYEDLDQVYQQELDGSHRRPVNTLYGADDFELDPAGTRIVYDTYDQQIAVTDLGSGATQTVYHVDGIGARSPRFSPDNQEIIFQASPSIGAAHDIVALSLEPGHVPRTLVAWPGQQAQPAYSANGAKITFTSDRDAAGKDLRGTYIYVANASGTGAVKVTAGTDPSFSPDGTRLVYSSGGEIFTIGVDGRNRKQMTSTGGMSVTPEWSPDGTTIAYSKGIQATPTTHFYAIWFVGQDGTNNREYISNGGNRSKFHPSFRQVSTTYSVNDYLAYAMAPQLYFDTSEKWRPLKVSQFLAEGRHTIGGTVIDRFDALRAFPSSTYTLDVAGEGSDENYATQDPNCLAAGLRDCDFGPASAAYYHVSNPSPGGYRYLDYWYFYRYNFFGSIPIANDFNHEADWEGVSVAPSTSGSTFDFVSFSQHGTWYSYLRDYLSCDGGGAGSCGTDASRSGRRPHAYVAHGSHANYPSTCSEFVWYACAQSNGAPERGHDGSARWQGDSLARFPAPVGWATPTQATFTDWPGRWGVERDVASPAAAGTGNGAHYQAPWSTECAAGPCAQPATVARLSALKPSRDAIVATSSHWCANWFAADVPGVVCDAERLGRGIRTASVDRRGGLRVTWPRARGRTAYGRGIAQVLGSPLRVGDRARIAGRARRGTVLFARAVQGRRLTTARFVMPRGGAVRGTLGFERQRGGRAALVLRLAGGRQVAASDVRTARVARGFVGSQFKAPRERPAKMSRFTTG